MAKKQTRRSVSIRGATYERIRNHCQVTGVSMSEFVEDQIAKFFSQLPTTAPAANTSQATGEVTAPKEPRVRADRRLSTTELQAAARIFTF